MKDFFELRESLSNQTLEELENFIAEGSLEEGKLPPHLAKFFDKDGNLNKDAEERVKKGRKAKGLDPYTGKKVKKEEVDESLGAMIKKKHDKTKKDQEDAKKNMALKSRLKKSGIHVKEETLGEAKESGMDIARRIVKDKQHEKGVDLTTANFILQVYNKVNDVNKKKMEGSSLKQLVGLVQKVMGK